MVSLQFVSNEGIFILWVKGKKVTLSNPLSRKFRKYLTKRPYLRDTRKILQAGMTLQFRTCASHVPFSWNPSHEPIVKMY